MSLTQSTNRFTVNRVTTTGKPRRVRLRIRHLYPASIMTGAAVLFSALTISLLPSTAYATTPHTTELASRSSHTQIETDSTSCSSSQSITVGALPLAGSITDPTQAACFTFADSSPTDTVLVNVDSTSGMPTPSTAVSNVSSSFSCGHEFSANQSECTLDASGPWTLEETDTNVGMFKIYIQSVQNPTGCQDVSYGPALIGGTVAGPADAACYVLTTPIDWLSITLKPISGNLDPEVELYGPGGAFGSTCDSTIGGEGGGDSQSKRPEPG